MTITRQYDEDSSNDQSKLAIYGIHGILLYIFILGLLIKGNIWIWSSIF
jgi:hypothetical protein